MLHVVVGGYKVLRSPRNIQLADIDFTMPGDRHMHGHRHGAVVPMDKILGFKDGAAAVVGGAFDIYPVFFFLLLVAQREGCSAHKAVVILYGEDKNAVVQHDHMDQVVVLGQGAADGRKAAQQRAPAVIRVQGGSAHGGGLDGRRGGVHHLADPVAQPGAHGIVGRAASVEGAVAVGDFRVPCVRLAGDLTADVLEILGIRPDHFGIAQLLRLGHLLFAQAIDHVADPAALVFQLILVPAELLAQVFRSGVQLPAAVQVALPLVG